MQCLFVLYFILIKIECIFNLIFSFSSLSFPFLQLQNKIKLIWVEKSEINLIYACLRQHLSLFSSPAHTFSPFHSLSTSSLRGQQINWFTHKTWTLTWTPLRYTETHPPAPFKIFQETTFWCNSKALKATLDLISQSLQWATGVNKWFSWESNKLWCQQTYYSECHKNGM